MTVYNRFAYVYDRMGSDRFSIKMFDYTLRLLMKLRFRPHSILDLACGTGTAAVLWAKNGDRVHGIDRSDQMLEMARTKAQEHHVAVDFSKQTMTSFALPEQVDLVTCYFDSLNYLLTLADVTACFKCVRRVMNDNAYFIFDVNTPEAMKVIWGSEVYADEIDDVAWIWKNCYFPGGNRAEVKATFFVRRENNTWERFEETHAERGYTTTEIRKLLKAAGLRPAKIYDCLTFSKPARKSMRLAVVAVKA
jgi:ubiquinone/menaquinone biosynthesis C-methylase UbiE